MVFVAYQAEACLVNMAKKIFALGVVILAVFSWVRLIDARQEVGVFLALMAIASVAYLLVIWLVHARAPGSTTALVGCLFLGLIFRVVLVSSSPIMSDDVYRYIWDGRVQQYGLNPYGSVPNDPELESLHTELTRRIHPTSAALPSIYPPLAQRLFYGITSIHESVRALAITMVVADALIVVLLWRWLVVAGRNRWWVLAYAWHPLVVLEGAGGAHIDSFGTLLLVASGLALSLRRSLLASVTFAGAIAIKFVPVVLLPLLWRRIHLTHAILAAMVLVLLYLPFMRDGVLPVGSLGTYLSQWRFNAPFFRGLEPLLGVPSVVVASVCVGLLVAGFARRYMRRDDPRAWAWPVAAAVVLMPAIYPWYLIWLTPFLTVAGTFPLVIWTVTSISTYAVWVSELGGEGWNLPMSVELFEYGCVAASAVGIYWFNRSSGQVVC